MTIIYNIPTTNQFDCLINLQDTKLNVPKMKQNKCKNKVVETQNVEKTLLKKSLETILQQPSNCIQFVKKLINQSYCSDQEWEIVSMMCSTNVLNNFINNIAKIKEDVQGKFEWCWHGSTDKALNSILKFGFYGPHHSQYKMRNGQVYGTGIYLTNSIPLALEYTETCEGGQSILLCCAFVDQTSKKSRDNIIVVPTSKYILPMCKVKRKVNILKFSPSISRPDKFTCTWMLMVIAIVVLCQFIFKFLIAKNHVN